MVPVALLVPAYAIAVVSSRPADEGCPSARQVSDALALRIPGVIAPAAQPLPPGVLELDLDVGAGGIEFALRDHTGELRLSRQLAAAPECAALAETIGLIVERFLQEIGYLGPPAAVPLNLPEARAARDSPPPSSMPRMVAGLQLQGALRASAGEDALFELGFAASLRQTRWFEQIELGYVPQQKVLQMMVGETATLWRVPIRLSLFHSRPVGAGHLEPGVALGLDLLQARLTRQDTISSSFRVSPSIQAALAYRLAVGAGWYARLEAAAVLNLVRYEFAASWDGNLFPESRFQGRMVMALGRLF